MRLLEEMAVFAKVGELGSISAAARALALPKSSVSRAVSRLEAAFSARLVERTTRQVTLTEIGRSLHAHCLALVAEAESAEAEIDAYQGHPSGRLRVAAPSGIGRQIVGPAVPDFLARYPDVDLELQLVDRPMHPVADGYDVVLRSGWLEDSDAVARKITDVGLILSASRDYAARRGLPGSIEELEAHPVIGFPTGAGPVFELVRGKERAKVRIWERFACNDPLINLEMVRRGVAIAPTSVYFAADLLLSGELVPVLPDYRLHNPPVLYALYAGRRALSPKIAVFLDFMTELARGRRAELTKLPGLASLAPL